VQNSPAVIRLLMIGVLAMVPRALAQNAFVAYEDGQFRLVKEVRFGRPHIDVGGKLTPSYSVKFALMKMPAYLRGFVTLPKFTVQTHHLNVVSTGKRLNYELRIRGSAKSDVTLKNCFFVLELTSEGDTSVAYAELPDLEAGKEEDFNLVLQLTLPLEEGRYALHFFSDGGELLHSKMPPAYVDAQKQKADGFWSGSTPDFRAIPFRRVRPVYPRELIGQALEGRVQVSCRISAHGEVESADMIECNHQAFAEPALAAVRQWKFDPAVKDRRLVESTEIVTLQIKPPKLAH
jgi:TonB family protein